MRNYPLYDLSNEEFETLTVLLCRKILGEAVIPFAPGTDGGRDAKFNGKANCFPSESKPWEGKIVVQAKHTSKINASCSDSTFQTRLKNEVLPAIERLKSVNKIEYYLLFTNGKLTGKKDEKIEDLMNLETGIPNIIIANEKIQLWLRSYPDIVKEAKLNDLLRPLQFDERDLKHLVEVFHNNIPPKKVLEKNSVDFNYSEMTKKNKLNQLSQDYFDGVMKNHYLYFDSIRSFFEEPINAKLNEMFDDLVDELKAKITIKQSEYFAFEKLLDELYDYVISNNSEFDGSGKKRLVRVFINYMYCNCFIGKK